jgi:hypothetical protein
MDRDLRVAVIGVHIAHDCQIGKRCIIANYVQFAGHVHVEDNVNMGGHCAVHHFVTVGTHAFVGGMTRVSADVPPFMVVVAARGSRTETRMVNGVGLLRSGCSEEDIAALKSAYMKIFSRRARLSRVGIRDRVQAILDDEPVNPRGEYLCRFLLRSFAHGRHGRYLESLRADPVFRNTWKLDNKYKLTVKVVGRGSVEKQAHCQGRGSRFGGEVARSLLRQRSRSARADGASRPRLGLCRLERQPVGPDEPCRDRSRQRQGRDRHVHRECSHRRILMGKESSQWIETSASP